MTSITLDSEESWSHAKSLAKLLGPMPSIVVNLVRILFTEGGDKPLSAMPARTIADASRILSAQGIRSILSCCSKVFKGVSLDEASPVEALTAKFSSAELAVLMAVGMCAPRYRKLCNAEEYPFFLTIAEIRTELAAMVATTIDKNKLASGLLLGAFEAMGMGLFLLNSHKEFKEYRRIIKKYGYNSNAREELTHWGCTSGQLATILAQSAGFGVNDAQLLGDALAVASGAKEKSNMAQGGESEYVRIAHWLYEFGQASLPPRQKVLNEAPDGLPQLLNPAINMLQTETAKFHFMSPAGEPAEK